MTDEKDTYIVDTETNALKDYSKLHVAVFRRTLDNSVTVFRNCHLDPAPINAFLDSIRGSTLVCHNFIGFDCGVLEHFCSVFDRHLFKIVDTLVLSRLLNYNQEHGHSLEAWGNTFGEKKSEFSDFSAWSQELEGRCISDTSINLKLYNFFSRFLNAKDWQQAIETEHESAWRCRELEINGFSFDYDKAVELQKELEEKVNKLLASFSEVFKPKTEFIREVHPRATKSGSISATDFRWLDGKDLRSFSVGAPFSLFTYKPFNPNSTTQRVERLNEAGWKPYNKTKGHNKAEMDLVRAKRAKKSLDVEALEARLDHFRVYGWSVDDDNLATLPDTAPEAAKTLVSYLLLSSRLSDIVEWLGLYNHHTGHIHGRFNSIGSWTHRKSHQAPNMANVPSLTNRQGKTQPYGAEFRSLFKASKGKVLVGCDAEGVQLRIFAHLCNDKRLIDAIVSGNKDQGTDIHTLNKRLLGTICNSREVAKTYIYALLLTAGINKQASILNCTKREALEGLERILDYYPGWQELTKGRLKSEGLKGFFEGLDGRKVMVPSPHKVLAGHLQNGESTIMKMACNDWHKELRKLQIPFTFVDDVHDEWQTETDPEFAQKLAQVQEDSIRLVGEKLGLNCALAGKAVIGLNWKETH